MLEPEQRRDLTRAAMSRLEDYFVGFVRQEKEGDFDLGGSGTLVTLGGKRDIRTAAHVVDALTPDVGLIFAVKSGIGAVPHSVTFPLETVARFFTPPRAIRLMGRTLDS